MFLKTIKLDGILTFKDAELKLRSLNVLIGANASGKSNLIRTIGLLRALPRDFAAEINAGGGPRAWINHRASGGAGIEVAGGPEAQNCQYILRFMGSDQGLDITEEWLGSEFERASGRFRWEVYKANSQIEALARARSRKWNQISPSRSVLAEVRSPDEPRLRRVSDAFESIRLYREFRTGPKASARYGISAAALGAYLDEDGGNLALVLNELNAHGELERVNEYLGQLFDLFTGVFVLTRNGIAQVYMREKGVAASISAVGLSDGTLRLLCLLAVLLDPTPPPLVCIEEPEGGLHPDAIRMIAKLLMEASTRTQLIVTTHSPALVDALTSQPESVVVCERDFDGFTQFRRLKSGDLDEWLERYSLGELWQKGEIGGNRW